MNRQQLYETITKLEKQKKGLERNRVLSVLLAIFLGYNVWNVLRVEAFALWFVIVMAIIIIAVLIVAFTGHRRIKEITMELERFYRERDRVHGISES